MGAGGCYRQPPHKTQLRTLFSCLPGVQSALYGLALSLLICVAAVAVFTTHVLLLLPVLLSILGMWRGEGGAGNRHQAVGPGVSRGPAGGLRSGGSSPSLTVTHPY